MKPGVCVALVSFLALAASEAQHFEIFDVQFTSLTPTTFSPGDAATGYTAQFQYLTDAPLSFGGRVFVKMSLSTDLIFGNSDDFSMRSFTTPIFPKSVPGGTVQIGHLDPGRIGVDTTTPPGQYNCLIFLLSNLGAFGSDNVEDGSNVGVLASQVTVTTPSIIPDGRVWLPGLLVAGLAAVGWRRRGALRA